LSGRKHVALFIRSLGADGAGAERVWLNLAAEFAARGHRVDLVLGRRTGYLADAVPAQVRVVDLAVRSPWPLIGALLRDPVAAGSLAPCARCAAAAVDPRRGPGARRLSRARAPRRAALGALLFEPRRAVGARARREPRAGRGQRAEHVVGAVGACARPCSGGALPKVEARWYPRADAILAVSEGVADDLARTARIARERITVTYNPIDLAAVEAAAREPVRARMAGVPGSPRSCSAWAS
jgi:hypothetical protein